MAEHELDVTIGFVGPPERRIPVVFLPGVLSDEAERLLEEWIRALRNWKGEADGS